jgi:hypothetical protein
MLHTYQEAIEALKFGQGQLTNGDWEFAQSLLKSVAKRKGPPTDKQALWLMKLATAAVKEPEAPKPKVEVGDMQGVVKLFEFASKHLKFPAVVLGDVSLGAIRLFRAGEKAKVPGSVTVVGIEGGTNDWLGRVLLDGKFEARKSGVPDSLVELIRAFAKEPAKVAAEHGKLTGKCCFCNSVLTDEKSTAVGYGPVCAKRFGLEWGGKKNFEVIELIEAALYDGGVENEAVL